MATRSYAVVDLYGGAAVITTNTQGSGVDVGATYTDVARREIAVTMRVTAALGATLTLDAEVQENTTSAAAGFTALTGGTFTQVTTNGTASETIYVKPTKRYMRVIFTVGGVTSCAPVVFARLGKRSA